jgi:hypothetical protein
MFKDTKYTGRIGGPITMLCMAGLFAGAAAAQQPTAAQQSAIKSACRSDFMAQCSGVSPGGSGRAVLSAAAQFIPLFGMPVRNSRARRRQVSTGGIFNRHSNRSGSPCHNSPGRRRDATRTSFHAA